jgi:DNA-binding IclR family transcriptional regulator
MITDTRRSLSVAQQAYLTLLLADRISRVQQELEACHRLGVRPDWWVRQIAELNDLLQQIRMRGLQFEEGEQ